MLRTVASSLLSLLVVVTLLWGGCISCEQYFMWSGAKTCCSPEGRCKTKSPAGQKKSVECKQIAFEHQKSINASVTLPIVSAVPIEPPLQQLDSTERWLVAHLIEPSPPDLQILHSTFLI